ncbi:MAG: Omp28-related outer membrane protein [Reichenbachiella sp.]|uniref:Omp28-related outer membrane protein n=1 Tax=Reichenbachiella sp. TaxID=2184521 RepID=UPI003267ACB3
MPKLNTLLAGAMLFSLTLFTACGDSEDSTITAITISADSQTIKPNGSDKVQISAVDQSGNDITSQVTFSIGNTVISEEFTTTEMEDFEVIGRYKTIESNTLTISGVLQPTSLTLSMDKTEIKANGFSFVKLSATDEDGDDVSRFVTFLNGSDELYTSVFASRVTGDFSLKAKYDNIESDEVDITVTQSNSQNKKILIEEFTGEWCGWCPQAGYNLDLISKFSETVITVGIHNGDSYEYSNESGLRSKLGVTFFPDGRISRSTTGGAFNAPTIFSADFSRINSDIEDYLEEETMLGIAINTSVANGELTVSPTIKFYDDITSDIYLTVYLLENNLPASAQQNYFENLDGYEESAYYSEPAILSDYAHDHVLRKNLTDAFGDMIPAEDVGADMEFVPESIVTELGDFDEDHVSIVAFVHYDIDGNSKVILNAQKVKAGENISYDDL